MTQELWLWIGFNAFIVGMLVLDLAVFHKKPHEVKFKEAAGWSVFWIALALVFNAGLWFVRGQQAGLEFLTAYLIEKSLSVDNLFVFLLVFSYFAVPAKHQHGVLFWGILGALVFRFIFIIAGIELLESFHWLIYVFGAILIVSGVKLWQEKEKKIEPEKNPLVRLFRRLMPVTPEYHDGKFFVRQSGKLAATPLFVVLLVVETTDIVFAVDSIPAVLAITRDPFIVYSSNAFAILGLRALYFALSGVMRMFHHLHYGLSAVLVFIGVKMIASEFVKVPTVASLAVVAAILAVSIWASLRWPAKGGHAVSETPIASGDTAVRPEVAEDAESSR
ncbi:MAG: TerC family protein [Candidatus Eisenbacteria bacterium]|nr:TerC family protein [Candidatus Eisenbacteria bacterium]